MKNKRISSKHELLGLFDTGLKVVKDIDEESLGVPGFEDSQERYVYLVEDSSGLYVFKAYHQSNEWRRKHIEQEIENLQKARDLEGITHLVEDLGAVDGFVAILKEYAEGTALKYVDKRELRLRPLKRQVRRTVKDLHNVGVWNIDVSPRHLIISPDKSKATLIDLGSYLENAVEKSVKKGNLNLGWMFRK